MTERESLGEGRTLNAYAVATKDRRTYKEPILDDGTGPLFDIWPCAPVVAASPGQAKTLFLKEYGGCNSGVETDDFPNLRVRTLAKNVDLPAGVHDQDESLWALMPE